MRESDRKAIVHFIFTAPTVCSCCGPVTHNDDCELDVFEDFTAEMKDVEVTKIQVIAEFEPDYHNEESSEDFLSRMKNFLQSEV